MRPLHSSPFVLIAILAGMVLCRATALADEATAKVWTVNSSVGTPYSKVDGTGPIDLILAEIFRRAHIPARVVFAPPQRSLFDVNEGIDDADGFRSKELKGTFPHLICVPEPVLVAQFRAYMRSDFPRLIYTIAELQPYHVGIFRGRPMLVKALSQVSELTEVNSQESLFQMLEAGRFDVVVAESFAAETVIKSLGYQEAIKPSQLVVSVNLHLYINEKHQNSLDQLNRAIREMRADHFVEHAFSHEPVNREDDRKR